MERLSCVLSKCNMSPVHLQILLLNGSHDRETACCGAHDGPMTAADIVQAVRKGRPRAPMA